MPKAQLKTSGAKLLVNEYPLMVLPRFATEVGLNEAIVLQQVHYWSRHNGHLINGRRWVYNTYEKWQQDNFPFWSEHTIQRLFTKLEDKNFLMSDNFNKSKFNRTKWYTINYDKIDDIAETIAKKGSHPSRQSGNNVNSNPEQSNNSACHDGKPSSKPVSDEVREDGKRPRDYTETTQRLSFGQREIISNNVDETSTENQQKDTVEPDNNSSNDNHRENENNQEKTKKEPSNQTDDLDTGELNSGENKLEEEKNKKDVTHNSNVNTVGTNNSKQKLNEEKNNSKKVTKKNKEDEGQKDNFLNQEPPGPSNKFKRNSENNLNKEKEKIKDLNNSNKGKRKNKVKKTNSSSDVKEGQSSAPHDGKTQHDDMHTCSDQARKLTEKIDDELRKNGCQALSRKAQERIPAQLDGYLEKYPYGLIAESVTEVIENLGKSNKPTKRISSAKYFLSTIKNQQENWSRQNKVRNQIAQSVLKRRKGENNG